MTPADAAGPDRTLAVGELARATGLSVRALHHYDQLGLLSPARDGGGRRRYGPAEVSRLHQILVLRGFGLPLAEIAQLLDGTVVDPRELLRRQLEQAEERIAAAQRVRTTILAVIGALAPSGNALAPSGNGAGPSTGQLIELIERMIIMDQKFTPEQFEQLARRRREMADQLTPEEFTRLQERRAEALSALSPGQLAELQHRRRQLLPEQTP
jgi:MerR family transcriptional regulator, thiopeptide resistance regulator